MRRKNTKTEIDDKTILPNYRYYGKKHGSVILEKIGVFLTMLLFSGFVGLVVFIFLSTMLSLYLYVGVLIPTLISVIFVSVLVHFLFNRIIKRFLFIIKLCKVCKKHHYESKFYVGFFRSWLFKSSGYHFRIETENKTFLVRYLASYKYNSELIFQSKEKVVWRMNSDAHRNKFKIIFGTKEKYKVRPFFFDDTEDILEQKEVVRVILMNPVPREVSYIKNGAKEPTGSGERMFGYILYNGSGFIKAISETHK